MLILLVAGVAGFLPAGVYAVYLAASAAYVVSICALVRRHSWKETATNLFTPGFVIFTVAFALFAVCNKGKLVHEMDAFSHWGDVVKSMTLLDDFGTNAASLTEFKSYPPGISLFQYFYEKTGSLLHGGTRYTEWFLYHAYQVMLAAFVAPVFSRLSHRKPATALICSICVFAAPLVMYYNTYDSLYVDSLLGILSGCALAMMVFTLLNNWLGYLSVLNSLLIIVILSVICAILPLNGMVVIGVLIIVGHSFGLGLEVGAFSAIVYLLMVLLYFRFVPKDALVTSWESCL